jgi:hypothetical protein
VIKIEGRIGTKEVGGKFFEYCAVIFFLIGSTTGVGYGCPVIGTGTSRIKQIGNAVITAASLKRDNVTVCARGQCQRGFIPVMVYTGIGSNGDAVVVGFLDSFGPGPRNFNRIAADYSPCISIPYAKPSGGITGYGTRISIDTINIQIESNLIPI